MAVSTSNQRTVAAHAVDPASRPEFRTRFVHGALLLGAYRLIGTLAAFIGLLMVRGDLVWGSPVPWFLTFAVIVYVGWLVGMSTHSARFQTQLADVPVLRSLFRSNRTLFDRSTLYWGEVVAVAAFNLGFVVALPDGVAYGAFADLFGAASVVAVAMVASRYGLWRGLAALAVMAVVEVVKAPLNQIPLAEVSWFVVVSRILWTGCGLFVGLALRRTWSDFSDHTEAGEVNALVRMKVSAKTHDFWKVHVGLIGAEASSLPPDADDAAVEACFRRLSERVDVAKGGPPPDDDIVTNVRELCERVVQAQAATFTDMQFKVLPGGLREPMHLSAPEAVKTALEQLLMNAGNHSRGNWCYVRITASTPSEICIQVCDDGIGMQESAPDDSVSTGLSRLRLAVREAGGSLRQDVSVRRGTSWYLYFEASATQQRALVAAP